MKTITRSASLATVLVALAVPALTSACASSNPPPMTPASATSPEQKLVNDAADAVRAMRGDAAFKGVDDYLARARGVLIFPHLRKAGLILGGEGGTGVLLARTDGGWSAPAFYRLAAGSAGLQIGYEESTVILAIMTKSALDDAIKGGLTLGADATLAAGTVGASSATAATSPAADVVQFVDASGVFAGASLSGAVISVRTKYNQAYYGAAATPRAIVLDGRFTQATADPLRHALPE